MPKAGRHGARQRKPNRDKRERKFLVKGDQRERQYRTEGVTGAHRASRARPYAAAASAALLGASLITASPAAAAQPTPTALRVASADVRLAAAANILNIPINLAIDLVNAPYNEVQAVD